MPSTLDLTAIDEAQLNDGSFAYLKANSAHALPDTPTANGWSAAAIKRQMYKSTDILFLWLRKLASATKEELLGVSDALDALRLLVDAEGNVIPQTYVKDSRIESVSSESGSRPQIPSMGKMQAALTAIKQEILDGASVDMDTLKEAEEAVAQINAALATKVTYLTLNAENGLTSEKIAELNVGDNEDGYTSIALMKTWDGELVIYFTDDIGIYLRSSEEYQGNKRPVFEGDIPKPNALDWVGHIKVIWDGVFLRIWKSEETENHTAIPGDELESILN